MPQTCRLTRKDCTFPGCSESFFLHTAGGCDYKDLTPKELMAQATAFVEEHILQCAKDLQEWKRMGVLPEGKFREAGAILQRHSLYDAEYLQIIEALVVREVLRIFTAAPSES